MTSSKRSLELTTKSSFGKKLKTQDLWQINFKTNAERMEFVLKNSFFTDVTFLLGEMGEIEIKGSSFVLAVSSPVMEKMFFGNLNNERTVVIPDTSRDNFYQFLKFIYTETCDVTLDNVAEIMYLAKKYMVVSLENYCKEFGLKNLTIDNVMETLRFCEIHEITNLRDECISVIQNNTEDILGSSKFGFTEVNEIKTILSLNSLSISENNLCKFIFEHLQETDSTIAVGKNIRQKMGDCFNLLRFLTLSVEEFLEIVYKYKEMFTNEETIGILMKISLAIDTSELSFSSTPRSMIESFNGRQLQSIDINSYGATTIYTKIEWKEMKFSVNREIWICGVNVFGKKEVDSKTIVFLKFIDGNGTTILEKMVKHKQMSSSTYAIKINFGRQCLVKANTDYTICIRYEDTIGPFYYGTNTHPPIRKFGNNIEFDFKSKDSAFNTLYFKY